MAFGDTSIRRGDKSADVRQLQLRLSGFRGTVWDGDFGPGTELQVVTFQRDYMQRDQPDGVVDEATLDAVIRFADAFPIDFAPLRCPCGACEGFGEGRHANRYRSGMPRVERYHRKEYPGIHKAILHAYRAARFYLAEAEFPAPMLTSGYRCWHHNEQKGRTSTNHMGKTLDFDFPLADGEDRRDDMNRCDAARARMVGASGFQQGWAGGNIKALEPSSIAPTWIHMDVRSYEPKYLRNEYFVTSLEALDALD